jgi:hypothetical protein
LLRKHTRTKKKKKKTRVCAKKKNAQQQLESAQLGQKKKKKKKKKKKRNPKQYTPNPFTSMPQPIVSSNAEALRALNESRRLGQPAAPAPWLPLADVGARLLGPLGHDLAACVFAHLPPRALCELALTSRAWARATRHAHGRVVVNWGRFCAGSDGVRARTGSFIFGFFFFFGVWLFFF